MPSNTPARGIPYPEPNDPINAYPALAAQAAGILDAHDHDNRSPVGHGHPLAAIDGLAGELLRRAADPNPRSSQLFIQAGRGPVDFVAGRARASFPTPMNTIAVAANLLWTGTAGMFGLTSLLVETIDGNGFTVRAYTLYGGGSSPEAVTGTQTVSWIAVGG